MGERKVLNKYFPPDFDPSLIPRGKRPKNKQIEVRMMLPMSIQCNTCGEYMYRGKKFNSRKEDVLEEDYHGIRIFRFYIKCVACSAEITFKTDPEHGDYATEKGCSRNFEPWRQNEAAEDQVLKEREEEEKGDAMKALENRTLDSKREMDIIDALDEMKAINQRHQNVDTEALLAAPRLLEDHKKQKMEEEDAKIAKEIFAQNRLKRKADPSFVVTPSITPEVNKTETIPNILFRPKENESNKTKKKKSSKKKEEKTVVSSLVGSYSSSDSN